MALQTTLTTLIAAAEALTIGQRASWIVPESLLKADIVALDTWVSDTTLDYSVTITKLFTNPDTETLNQFGNDVEVTEGEEYFMVTCVFPPATVLVTETALGT